jgi:hypothetical protein
MLWPHFILCHIDFQAQKSLVMGFKTLVTTRMAPTNSFFNANLDKIHVLDVWM